MAIDPVCSMEIDERKAAGSSVFEGSNYYFCSAGCKKKFETNPSVYIGAPSTGDPKEPGHAHHGAQPMPDSPGRVHGKTAGAGVAPHGAT